MNKFGLEEERCIDRFKVNIQEHEPSFEKMSFGNVNSKEAEKGEIYELNELEG